MRGLVRQLACTTALIVLAPVPALAGTPSSGGVGDAVERARTTIAPLVGAGDGDDIADHYIVVLDQASSDASLESVVGTAERNGGTVRFAYRSALRGFSAELPAAALDAVRRAPGVDYVEADTTVRLEPLATDAAIDSAPTTTPAAAAPIWNLDRIDQRSLPLDEEYGPLGRGAGVTAYVIDTGIWFTHPEFQERATSGYDFVDDDSDARDCNGHGTHVAGTIGGRRYGVANKTELVALRVLSCEGSGPKSQVIAGIDWVTENAVRPAVANLSLGGRASRAQDQAVAASIRSGVTYTVAAGNEAQDACNRSPARARPALTVGATDDRDVQWEDSNFGRCLDLYAPGVAIRSAWPSDSGVTNTISGTSMAAPHVAGTAAVYLADHPAAPAREVRRAILRSATEGALTGLGPDSPNRLLYVTAD